MNANSMFIHAYKMRRLWITHKYISDSHAVKLTGMLLCCNVMRVCCNIFTKLKLLFVIDGIREVFRPCERCISIYT